MKEKTFEELIRERIDKGDAFTPTGIIEMMQQVREATIAEVLTLCDENFLSKEPKGRLMENIEEMKTDRIKLT